MRLISALLFLFIWGTSSAQQDSLLNASHGIPKNDYQKILNTHFDFTISTSGIKPISFSSFSYPNTCMSGMFCKMEYKIEKVSMIAPRFRLGSVSYANWMEGKGKVYSKYW